MEIVVKFDTRNPASAEDLRREAQYLLWVADNREQFLSNAAAAGVAVQTVVADTPTAQVPPPPPAPIADAIGGSTNVPPAPAAQIPPPPQAPTADAAPATVDKTGLPWDARIHSGKPTINADGTWKKRKGVTAPVVAAVEAELRGGQASAQVPPPPPPAPTADAQVPAALSAAAAQVPPPPPAVPGAAVGAVTPPPSPLTLLQRLAGAVSTGKVSFEEVLKEAAMYGCSDLGQVSANPSVGAMLEQTFAARGVI